MWIYPSEIGILQIVYLPESRRYGFRFDGTVWETCDTPDAEADNVARQVTGCDEWDDLLTDRIPSDLSEWEFRPTEALPAAPVKPH